MNKSTYEQELAEKGVLIYTTTGMSMRPFLRSGQDLMVIEAKKEGRCRVRDVVLYRRQLEPGIRDDQILGVLTAVIRQGKRTEVSEAGYRRKVFAWWALYPVRAVAFWLRYQFGRLWSQIKR